MLIYCPILLEIELAKSLWRVYICCGGLLKELLILKMVIANRNIRFNLRRLSHRL